MAGKVSVIIPTRNRADLLSRSLTSVSMQTHPDIELIVIDDSSTDAVRGANLALVQSCCPEALYLKLPPDMSGRGPGFPRNFGIEQCTGAYVAFLDDDDEWIDPAYLEVATATMALHGYDVHFADQEAMFTNGSVQRRRSGLRIGESCCRTPGQLRPETEAIGFQSTRRY